MDEKMQQALKEAEEKALQLTETLKVKVHPMVFKDPDNDEIIVGFIKEPSRMQKIAVMDKMTMGGTYSAGSELLDIILIREESDSRIYSEKSEDDKIYLGAVSAAADTIRLLIDQSRAKKKN